MFRRILKILTILAVIAVLGPPALVWLGGLLGAVLPSLGALLLVALLVALVQGLLREAPKPPRRRRKRKRSVRRRRKGYRHHLDDLIRQQNGKCAICGHRLPLNRRDLIHIDHIRPIHLGGTDAKQNLRAVHAKCNLGRTQDDYQQSA